MIDSVQLRLIIVIYRHLGKKIVQVHILKYNDFSTPRMNLDQLNQNF